MLGVFCTPLDLMQIIGIIIPLDFAAKITDTTIELKNKIFLTAFERETIVCKRGNRIHE
jgi:hypothetical protein